jgi:two-component system, chemotaxis family, chemotaxis protein CheY
MALYKSTPVLLVDGELSSLALISGLLGKAKFDTIETVEDADSAMEALTARGPRLVIAELNLDGTSGLQFLRTVRADDRLKKCPFILMAKSVTAAEAVSIKNAGADGLLLKPFRADALLTKIEAAFRARPKARRLPEPSIKKSFAVGALGQRFQRYKD